MDGYVFTHERLEAYKVAREFRALAHGLVRGMPRGAADTADQLSRAARSAMLTTAEGAGRRSPKEKAHFFDIARGSAEECAAIPTRSRSASSDRSSGRARGARSCIARSASSRASRGTRCVSRERAPQRGPAPPQGRPAATPPRAGARFSRARR